MANVSNTIESDDPSHFLRLLQRDHASDSATSVVLRHLLCRGAATSTEIVTATRLSRASVSLALIDLRSRGVVFETSLDQEGNPPRGRGRPQMKQSICPGIGFTAGVNVGLRSIRILFCDAAHNKLSDSTLAIDRDCTPQMASELIRDKLEAITQDHQTSLSELLGIGLAVAAPVSPDGKDFSKLNSLF